MFYLEVYLPIHHDKPFTYCHETVVENGMLVEVMLGRRKCLGLVLASNTKKPDALENITIKKITSCLFESPFLQPRQLKFLKFLSTYYCSPFGDVLRMALPGKLLNHTILNDNQAAHHRQVKTVVETFIHINNSIVHTLPPRALRLQGLFETIKKTSQPTLRSIRKCKDYTSARLARLQSLNLITLELCDRQLTVSDLGYGDRSKARDADQQPTEMASIPSLTEEQHNAIATIHFESSAKGSMRPMLLHGITGSGKTEIYLRIVEIRCQSHRQSLILLPEIALTPQFTARFHERFGDTIAVLHSHMTPKERLNQWMRVKNKQALIVIGARSALFAPFKDIGLIIIDEEHDASFKQDSQLRYHARDMAIVMAKFHNIPIVLGSATPSIESIYNAKTGKYAYMSLLARASGQALPRVEVIDMRTCTKKENQDQLTDTLLTAIDRETNAGRQVMLLINRRGYANFMICQVCGTIKNCPNCQISLTLHRVHRESRLHCHYCDHRCNVPQHCDKCQSQHIAGVGYGIEKFEKAIQQHFPQLRVARLDRDAVTTRKQLIKVIDDFGNHQIDILLGTQMIAKGHDFANVSLVGILNADQGLFLPDFRAAERAFQLITQVAGRAGRGQYPGSVIIQTYNPENMSIKCAVNHDYAAFIDREIQRRRDLHYPPFRRLALIECQGNNQGQVQRAIQFLNQRLQQTLESNEIFADVDLLGPSEAAIAKVKNKYRFHLIIRTVKTSQIQNIVTAIHDSFPRQTLAAGVRYTINIDPQSLI